MATSFEFKKRKASSAFIPDSVCSFVMGALRTNFERLKRHIIKSCPLIATNANPEQQSKKLLEELFRYLYLLADSSSDGVIRSRPSYSINQALHCLMLDPVLYWRVCEEILSMQGQDSDTVKVRVLPHDALEGEKEGEVAMSIRYDQTIVQYKETFGEDPPLFFWDGYSSNVTTVTVESTNDAVQLRHDTKESLHVATTSITSRVLPSSSREESLQDQIRLCFVINGKKQEVRATLGEKFSEITWRLAYQQKWNDYEFKKVELTYRRIVLRGYMMPYSFNMKDGDVIECIYFGALQESCASGGSTAACSRAPFVSPHSSASPLPTAASAGTVPAVTVPILAAHAVVPAHDLHMPNGSSDSKIFRALNKQLFFAPRSSHSDSGCSSGSDSAQGSQLQLSQEGLEEATWTCTSCTYLNTVAKARKFCSVCWVRRFALQPKRLSDDYHSVKTEPKSDP